MSENWGLAAGLLTSVLWTATSIFFTEAGRRLGSTVVNAIRIVLAVVLLGITYRFIFSPDGGWIPDANTKQLVYLGLSGIIGLSIGDQALFTAFVDVGPRLSQLLMTTAPLIAVLFGWVVLGEALGPLAWVGVALTLAGVAIVVLERAPTSVGRHPPHRMRGIVLALFAAACQAIGLLLSKVGIGHGWMPEEDHLDPQAATFVRMMFAAVGVAPILIAHWMRRPRLGDAARRREGRRNVGLVFVMLGTVVGPYLGVWMSLVAADATDVGVAQTLMSLSPILILPLAALLYREHIGVRAVVGAAIAVGGVALLFVSA